MVCLNVYCLLDAANFYEEISVWLPRTSEGIVKIVESLSTERSKIFGILCWNASSLFFLGVVYLLC